MRINTRQLLRWTPRLLGLLFAAFISIFALDVFGAGYGFWESILAFLIHLLPVYLLLIAVALGWKWQWPGALLFLAFGIWYLAINWIPAAVFVNILIAGPSLLVGILFLVDWFYELQQRHQVAHS